MHWECDDCGKHYYKCRGACPDCGSGKIIVQYEGKDDDDLKSYFRRLTIPQYLALLLSLSALFLVVFFGLVFV